MVAHEAVVVNLYSVFLGIGTHQLDEVFVHSPRALRRRYAVPHPG